MLLGNIKIECGRLLMRKKLFLAIAIAAAAISVRFVTAGPAHANSSAAVALTGQVSSQKEGLMQGVVVDADP